MATKKTAKNVKPESEKQPDNRVSFSSADGLPETPASAMVRFIIEQITNLMMAFGIKSLTVTRFPAGLTTHLVSTMEPFKEAPKDIVEHGVAAKDALAKIMSLANITRIENNYNEESMKATKTYWDGVVAEVRNKNAVSSASAAADNVADAAPARQDKDGQEIDIVDEPSKKRPGKSGKTKKGKR